MTIALYILHIIVLGISGTCSAQITQEESLACLQSWATFKNPLPINRDQSRDITYLSPLFGALGLKLDIYRYFLTDEFGISQAYSASNGLFTFVTKYLFYLSEGNVRPTRSIDAPANLLVQTGLLGTFIANIARGVPTDQLLTAEQLKLVELQLIKNKLYRNTDIHEKAESFFSVSDVESLATIIQQNLTAMQQERQRIKEERLKARTPEKKPSSKDAERRMYDEYDEFKKALPEIITDTNTLSRKLSKFAETFKAERANISSSLYPDGLVDLFVSMYLVAVAHEIDDANLIYQYTKAFPEPSATDVGIVPAQLSNALVALDSVRAQLPPNLTFKAAKESSDPLVRALVCVETSLIQLFNVLLYNPVEKRFDLDRLPAGATQLAEIYRRINQELAQAAQSEAAIKAVLDSEPILQLWGSLFANKDYVFYREPRKKDQATSTERRIIASGVPNVFTFLRIIRGQPLHPTASSAERIPQQQPKRAWSSTGSWSEQDLRAEMVDIITEFGATNRVRVKAVQPGQLMPYTAQITLSILDDTGQELADFILNLGSGHCSNRLIFAQQPAISQALESESLLFPLVEISNITNPESGFPNEQIARWYPLTCSKDTPERLIYALHAFAAKPYADIKGIYTILFGKALELFIDDYQQLLQQLPVSAWPEPLEQYPEQIDKTNFRKGINFVYDNMVKESIKSSNAAMRRTLSGRAQNIQRLFPFAFLSSPEESWRWTPAAALTPLPSRISISPEESSATMRPIDPQRIESPTPPAPEPRLLPSIYRQEASATPVDVDIAALEDHPIE